MRASVEFYQDQKGEYRWRFRINGRIMADSGEGYTRRRAAVRAFNRVAERLLGYGRPGTQRYSILGLD